jgi:hypothetical protein
MAWVAVLRRTLLASELVRMSAWMADPGGGGAAAAWCPPEMQKPPVARQLRARRRGRRYLRLVRNWLRCVVQSDPPVAFVAQLPCHPHTHVIV